MDHVFYFKEMFESFPDYKKILVITFFIQNDKNLLREIGFSKNVINRLNLEFKNFLIEQHEEYLHYVKDQEQSVLERFLNK